MIADLLNAFMYALPSVLGVVIILAGARGAVDPVLRMAGGVLAGLAFAILAGMISVVAFGFQRTRSSSRNSRS